MTHSNKHAGKYTGNLPEVYRYLLQRQILFDVSKPFLCERSHMPTATTVIVFINFQLRASILRLKLMHQKQPDEIKSAHGEAYCPDLYRCIIHDSSFASTIYFPFLVLGHGSHACWIINQRWRGSRPDALQHDMQCWKEKCQIAWITRHSPKRNWRISNEITIVFLPCFLGSSLRIVPLPPFDFCVLFDDDRFQPILKILI